MKTSLFVVGSALIIVAITVMLYANLRPLATPSEPVESGVLDIGGLGGPSAPVVSETGRPVTRPSASGVSSGPTLEIKTAGGAVLVNDFMATSSDSGRYADSGNYYIGTPIPSAEATSTPAIPAYSIVYTSETQYFNIELLKEPIASARREAEEYLKKRLGLSEGQMCMLDYTVSVPWRVNPFYTSMSLGFSFCPGAVQLPGR